MEADLVRQRLDEERARLEQVRDDQLQNDESQGANLGELSNMDQHQADVGTETFEREKDLSILENVEAELADIEHALSRLSDGTYGICEACGKPIDEERLEAMPAARLCLDDQAAAEQQARAGGIG